MSGAKGGLHVIANLQGTLQATVGALLRGDIYTNTHSGQGRGAADNSILKIYELWRRRRGSKLDSFDSFH